MAESQYLVQALQQIGSQPTQSPAPGMSMQQMAQLAKQRQAWEAANPGQSYFAHGIDQMGQNLANAPGRVAGAVEDLGQLPGQPLNGFQNLVRRFGGDQQTAPY